MGIDEAGIAIQVVMTWKDLVALLIVVTVMAVACRVAWRLTAR